MNLEQELLAKGWLVEKSVYNKVNPESDIVPFCLNSKEAQNGNGIMSIRSIDLFRKIRASQNMSYAGIVSLDKLFSDKENKDENLKQLKGWSPTSIFIFPNTSCTSPTGWICVPYMSKFGILRPQREHAGLGWQVGTLVLYHRDWLDERGEIKEKEFRTRDLYGISIVKVK